METEETVQKETTHTTSQPDNQVEATVIIRHIHMFTDISERRLEAGHLVYTFRPLILGPPAWLASLLQPQWDW